MQRREKKERNVTRIGRLAGNSMAPCPKLILHLLVRKLKLEGKKRREGGINLRMREKEIAWNLG